VDAYAFMVANQLCEIGTNSIYEYTDKFGIVMLFSTSGML
jgi:hypothetical protein